MATDEDRTNIAVQIGRPTVASQAAAPPPPPRSVAIADSFELQPGTMLGEYRVERKIGEGGMGMVFAAVHPVIAKRAAIKLLRRDYCADPVTVERFVDEARVVNQISHPNIVDVFAFGELPDGRRYFVMEWLAGETLRDRIDRGPMAVDDVCAVLRPLTLALSAAHERGVIHRDIKPDNVFLVENDGGAARVKLLDFGIAKLAERESYGRTAAGDLIGTPTYMPPEQAQGLAIGPGVDTYALGATAFEMLTGRPPFVAETPMEVVVMHTTEEAPAPSAFAVVPAYLDQLVVRMLAKDPAARPSLAEIGAVAERYLNARPSVIRTQAHLIVDEPPTAKAATVVRRVPPPRHEAPVAAAVPAAVPVPTAGPSSSRRFRLAVAAVIAIAALAFVIIIAMPSSAVDLGATGTRPMPARDLARVPAPPSAPALPATPPLDPSPPAATPPSAPPTPAPTAAAPLPSPPIAAPAMAASQDTVARAPVVVPKVKRTKRVVRHAAGDAPVPDAVAAPDQPAAADTSSADESLSSSTLLLPDPSRPHVKPAP